MQQIQKRLSPFCGGCFSIAKVPLVAQRVKRLPAMWETRVRPLVREDPLEKEIATHSSTLAWKIPRTEKPGRLQSMRSQRVGNDWATSLHFQVVSNSLWLHGLQHTRIPWPSRSPGVFSDSSLLSWWCYLTITSSATSFSFFLQSFPAPGSFHDIINQIYFNF